MIVTDIKERINELLDILGHKASTKTDIIRSYLASGRYDDAHIETLELDDQIEDYRVMELAQNILTVRRAMHVYN